MELREVMKSGVTKNPISNQNSSLACARRRIVFWFAYIIIIYHSSTNYKQNIHKLIRLACKTQQYINQSSIYHLRKNLPEKVLILRVGEVNKHLRERSILWNSISNEKLKFNCKSFLLGETLTYKKHMQLISLNRLI